MVYRKVTTIEKDKTGNITALCNCGEWWSPRSSFEIMNDIEGSYYGYYVIVNSKKIKIKVINGLSGKYLGIDLGQTMQSHLSELPILSS